MTRQPQCLTASSHRLKAYGSLKIYLLHEPRRGSRTSRARTETQNGFALVSADEMYLRALQFRFDRQDFFLVATPKLKVDAAHLSVACSSRCLSLLDRPAPIIIQFRFH